jgi:ADP-heptose:LPS heptosyltransferase
VKRPAASIRPGDRVLVTRLDYLGDAVLSLPLVDVLLSAGAKVDYLARGPGAELLAGERRFDRVFSLERGAGLGATLKLVSSLRRRRYRAVIDLYSNPRSAWLAWLTGAAVRVGGDRRGRRHLYTHPVRVDPSVRSAVDFHLEHARPLGLEPVSRRPSLEVTEAERASARRLLPPAVAQRPVVGVHPGGKWPVKRWPASSFAELVELVRGQMNAEVVVFTGPGEREHTDAVRRIVGEGPVYAPPVGIRELAAALASLDAMVACDGGVMHVSVAVGTPTVGIFGSSEPDVWFPYEGLGPFRAAYVELDCRPCHRHACPLGHTHCLVGLDAGAVLELVAGVVRGGDRRAGGG